ncbi:hypothetical protein QKU48_gp1246 [Fadolivirus algeromassiliense]|jgi:hypothetical protein|uniref:Uncharacterized protein n=1 Tax=Fadolivirus FV1/VV64 TaxID=3070911 RepID=A0A7D3QVX2_9VIRU|nr:hypothetical protein QKU48_gp1246 [Fadolivirus algeromassiliense]QKF94704.1 hypothetical protein Fadolivirus_1_1246 [Fadolivirus FV1/VV64]
MNDNINKILQDNEILKIENQKLKNENDELRKEIEELKEHLKKYTAPSRSKRFYENHKEEIIQKTKNYSKTHKPSKEKMQEYNKRAYLKRKEKQQLV